MFLKAIKFTIKSRNVLSHMVGGEKVEADRKDLDEIGWWR